MEITGKNLVGNETIGDESGAAFRAINPSSNEEIDPLFFPASSSDVKRSVEMAEKAFDKYKKFNGQKKAAFLESIAEQILALGDSLIHRAMLETALPEARLIGERGRTISQLKMFAKLVREGSWVEASIDTALPDREPVPKPDLRKMLVPLGPVAVFGASNFPLAFSTAGGDTASALAGGNPVIVKAHNSHPGTSELVASAISKAAEITGVPEGVFSHLQDSGFTVGKKLVMDHGIKAVAFTGSFSGGKSLFDAAVQREAPIPVFAEMGSVNPVFLFPGALKEKATEIAKSYAGSITLGVGQFCTNPGLILGLDVEETNRFADMLKMSIGEIKNSSMLNKGIFSNYNSKKRSALEQEGVETIAENVDSSDESKSNIPGSTIAMVDSNTFILNPLLHEEIFGPYSLIVKCTNEKDLIKISKNLKGQLTITIMANNEDLQKYKEVISVLSEKAGRLIMNGVPTGVEVCYSMHHGGPFPATTDSRFTSVGTTAIKRFVRPLAYQDWPQDLLPDELKDNNPLNIWRVVNSDLTKEKI